GADVIVKDSGGNVVGVGTVNEDGTFEVELDKPFTNGEELEVSLKDEAGNESGSTKVNAPDTTAPDAPDAEINDGNSVLTVKTESNAIVKAYDSEGKPLLDSAGKPIEFEADENGDASYTFDPALDRGKIINVTATDTAGNESAPTEIIVGVVEPIGALDNHVDVILNATPTETINPNPGENSAGGFALVNVGLGPVLGLDVLGDVMKNAIHVEVGENQIREVTVEGAAGGVQVVGTMDLYAYKLNDSTGEWEQQFVKENWIVSWLLGGKSKPTDFSLTEGQWMFVMNAGEGIQALTGFGLEFKKDVVLDYGNPKEISGSATGNMMTDSDARYGADVLPEGAKVVGVTGHDGVEIDISPNASTVIYGEHGVLTVKADGSYTYVVNDDFRGYGEKDQFTYTVKSPDGATSTADLIFDIDLKSSEERIVPDSVVLVDEIEPTVVVDTDKSEIKNAVNFSLLNLGLLGPILSADAITGKGGMEFSVGEDQVRELTIHGSGGGVSIGQVFDLYVYKLDPVTGNYQQVHVEDNWFTIILFGGKSDALTLKFGEGDYVIMMEAVGALGLGQGQGIYVDHDKIYDYSSPSKFGGSTSGDITEDAGTIVLSVGDQRVEPDKPATVQGEFGVLTLNSDGTYTYSLDFPMPKPEGWTAPYGEMDQFQVVTQDKDGQTIVETIDIKIGTHTAEDDFNSIMIDGSNSIESEVVASGKASNKVTPEVKEFEVKDNQILEEFIFKATGDSEGTGSRSKPMQLLFSLKNLTTGEVWSYESELVKDAELSLTLKDLPSGKYELTVTPTNGGGVYTLDVTANKVNLDTYKNEDPTTITGTLLENDLGWKMIDDIVFGNKQVSYTDDNKGAKSITVEGEHGTLVVNKDGTYTYTPSGESFGVERFTYETVSIVGEVESATLEINVGKQITASIYDDIVTSSAGDDTFVMKDGADTLLFSNLQTVSEVITNDKGESEIKVSENDIPGNGGNGLDTWADFNAADGDMIDITALLDGDQTAENIGNYLKYEDGTLFVDRKGGSEFEALLKVDAADLESLLPNINWEVQGDATQSAVIDLSNVESLVIDDADSVEPLTLTLDELISEEDKGEIPFFLDSEETTEAFTTVNTEQTVMDTTVYDVQPVVDPLDDLLDQKSTLV
ncbi:BapA/Bap/LapF family large adhesin, partial [Ignatzschineria indica]